MKLVLKIFAGLVALVLTLAGVGCAALHQPDIPYDTLRAQYQHAESAYQDLPSGVRMHYRAVGPEDAPVVLLIHGFAASTHTWETWTQILSGQYRMISLDLPGHGLTEAPENYAASIEGYVTEVNAFAAAQGLERFVIVGSSMGGHVSWEYALAHPGEVQGLVLVASAGWWDDRVQRDERPLIFTLLNTPVIGPLMRDMDMTALTRQGLQASFADPTLATEDMVARYVNLSRAPGHRKILLSITTRARDRAYATGEEVAPLSAIPTLILHGEQDNLVPVEYGRRFHDAIAGSELVTWPNAGHIPQEEVAEESAGVLATFLARVTAPAPEAAAEPAPTPTP